jgi:hypothetical protein
MYQVENTYFKIPRHNFQQDSAFFRDMFSFEADEGWTKEKPFHLDDV